ncbi:glutathione S-transferase N-terminal domain-containing protein [Pseudoxanthomonas helianthi]|uniref:Glutathione S-transferase N-terminal domain-containing protein n=1 Tax=Pseudoxanthomonas helianthi TaxID=1453541 RepID=A0A940X3R9_9GAMM|nr:glutathione binding-like protein [Pseudoxanthomonas helianthi]MBP3983788.1 glutathione S-transferase N-terminal domain-containing protein [Pseudoxanthomonas helianthi]
MIDLYYWPTPNGHKISLFLEEAGLDYAIKPVDIGKGDQFKPEYLAFSPNNKMPAIIDHAPNDGGAPISVFESGAILLYLANKTGRFLGFAEGADAATQLRQRIVVNEWLFWQMGGLGPMTGQYGHFHVYAPEQIPYAKDRYRNEALRLLGVLDRRLEGRQFIAGDEYSIADMASYPWINPYTKVPLDLAPFANVRRWQATIAARPATQRAYAVAKQVNPDAGKPMSEEEKKILFGQR